MMAFLNLRQLLYQLQKSLPVRRALQRDRNQRSQPVAGGFGIDQRGVSFNQALLLQLPHPVRCRR
ncbi:hypothetical protein D3C74_448220 [compost metagenome]